MIRLWYGYDKAIIWLRYRITKIFNVNFPLFEKTVFLTDYSGTHFYKEPRLLASHSVFNRIQHC